jgi:hypothetical protein
MEMDIKTLFYRVTAEKIWNYQSVIRFRLPLDSVQDEAYYHHWRLFRPVDPCGEIVGAETG